MQLTFRICLCIVTNHNHLIFRICLVASCPGGTASNVVTFLANADVALSVMMTTVSTFAAVVMTPLLTKTLVGAMVPVDAKALFVSTLQASIAVIPFVQKALPLRSCTCSLQHFGCHRCLSRINFMWLITRDLRLLSSVMTTFVHH